MAHNEIQEHKETMKKHWYANLDMKNRRHFVAERPWFLTISIAAMLIAMALFITCSFRLPQTPCLCSSTKEDIGDYSYSATPVQLQAILHYATSRVVPQQSHAEITVSFNVLQSLAPCNFLVFGLGHDSLMWTSLNPHGTTLFLEEDPKWIQSVLRHFPNLNAHLVNYPTRLSQANQLLSTYKQEESCLPRYLLLKGNARCKLALSKLPDEVYDTEWDLIMIDAPRGYFNEAPGRMGAIYTAAVLSRTRTYPGVTHVFLHDVNRKVEKAFAEEFLCKKYLVKAVGRLWHFKIPAAAKINNDSKNSFC